jgi:hypothetical protein
MLLGRMSVGFYRLHGGISQKNLFVLGIVSAVAQPVARHFSIENVTSASSSALMPLFRDSYNADHNYFSPDCSLYLKENF